VAKNNNKRLGEDIIHKTAELLVMKTHYHDWGQSRFSEGEMRRQEFA
jgi:hypothetical protein